MREKQGKDLVTRVAAIAAAKDPLQLTGHGVVQEKQLLAQFAGGERSRMQANNWPKLEVEQCFVLDAKHKKVVQRKAAKYESWMPVGPGGKFIFGGRRCVSAGGRIQT